MADLSELQNKFYSYLSSYTGGAENFFKNADTDKNDVLVKGEFTKMMQGIRLNGQSLTNNEIDQLWRTIDTDVNTGIRAKDGKQFQGYNAISVDGNEVKDFLGIAEEINAKIQANIDAYTKGNNLNTLLKGVLNGLGMDSSDSAIAALLNDPIFKLQLINAIENAIRALGPDARPDDCALAATAAITDVCKAKQKDEYTHNEQNIEGLRNAMEGDTYDALKNTYGDRVGELNDNTISSILDKNYEDLTSGKTTFEKVAKEYLQNLENTFKMEDVLKDASTYGEVLSGYSELADDKNSAQGGSEKPLDVNIAQYIADQVGMKNGGNMKEVLNNLWTRFENGEFNNTNGVFDEDKFKQVLGQEVIANIDDILALEQLQLDDAIKGFNAACEYTGGSGQQNYINGIIESATELFANMSANGYSSEVYDFMHSKDWTNIMYLNVKNADAIKQIITNFYNDCINGTYQHTPTIEESFSWNANLDSPIKIYNKLSDNITCIDSKTLSDYPYLTFTATNSKGQNVPMKNGVLEYSAATYGSDTITIKATGKNGEVIFSKTINISTSKTVSQVNVSVDVITHNTNDAICVEDTHSSVAKEFYIGVACKEYLNYKANKEKNPPCIDNTYETYLGYAKYQFEHGLISMEEYAQMLRDLEYIKTTYDNFRNKKDPQAEAQLKDWTLRDIVNVDDGNDKNQCLVSEYTSLENWKLISGNTNTNYHTGDGSISGDGSRAENALQTAKNAALTNIDNILNRTKNEFLKQHVDADTLEMVMQYIKQDYTNRINSIRFNDTYMGSSAVEINNSSLATGLCCIVGPKADDVRSSLHESGSWQETITCDDILNYGIAIAIDANALLNEIGNLCQIIENGGNLSDYKQRRGWEQNQAYNAL